MARLRPPSVPRKTAAEIELMRRAGRILAECLDKLKRALRPGITTAELDRLAEDFIRSRGGVPSFKGYNGYPASICVEIEDVVVHGIPSPDCRLREGTIVGIDAGVCFDGWHADAAFTAAIGQVDELRTRLMKATRAALQAGIEKARPGNKLAEVCRAIQEAAEGAGFSVVRALVGHGIGRRLHEPPQIPNFYEPGEFLDYEITLRPGMALAIEPMVNAGTADVRVDSDGWTTRTADGKPSAHFEHTVIITRQGPEIITAGAWDEA